MTLGTGNKRNLIILGVLALGAGYAVYSNVLSGPDTPAAARSPRTADPMAAVEPGAAAPAVRGTAPAAKGPDISRAGVRARDEGFHPVLHPKRAEDRPDVANIDPELKLYLLAKVQQVPAAGGERNLFQFGTAPAPKVELKGPEPKIVATYGPSAPAPEAPPAPPPPPPPIALKYYGFSTQRDNGKKTAFFLDGDEIIPANEGEVVKKRYKVVTIGVNSVLMEDTQAKRQQRVQLMEEAPASGAGIG